MALGPIQVEECHIQMLNMGFYLADGASSFYKSYFLGLPKMLHQLLGIRNYGMKTWVCMRPVTTDQTPDQCRSKEGLEGGTRACNLSDTKSEAIQIFTIYVIWPYVVIEKKLFHEQDGCWKQLTYFQLTCKTVKIV